MAGSYERVNEPLNSFKMRGIYSLPLSILASYGKGNRGFVVRFRAEARDFSLLPNRSERLWVLPSLLFIWQHRVRSRSEAVHSPPSSVPRLGMKGIYLHTASYLCGVYRDNDYKYLHAIVMRKEIFATFCPDAVSLLVETFADTGAICMSRRKLTRTSTRLTFTVATAKRKLKCQLNYLLSG